MPNFSKIDYPHPFYLKQGENYRCLLCLDSEGYNVTEDEIKKHLKSKHRDKLINNIFKDKNA